MCYAAWSCYVTHKVWKSKQSGDWTSFVVWHDEGMVNCFTSCSFPAALVCWLNFFFCFVFLLCACQAQQLADVMGNPCLWGTELSLTLVIYMRCECFTQSQQHSLFLFLKSLLNSAVHTLQVTEDSGSFLLSPSACDPTWVKSRTPGQQYAVSESVSTKEKFPNCAKFLSGANEGRSLTSLHACCYGNPSLNTSSLKESWESPVPDIEHRKHRKRYGSTVVVCVLKGKTLLEM